MTTPSVLDQLHKFRYQTTTRETPWALIRSLNVAALRVHPPDLQQLSHLTSALSDCRLPATSTLFSKTDVSASHPTAVPPPPSGGQQTEAAMYVPSAMEVEQLLHVQQVVLQFALRSQSILKDQLLSKQQTAAVQSVTLQQYTTMTTRLEEAKQRLADAATEKQSLQTVLHNYEKQIVELKTKCQMLEKEGSYFRSLAEKSQAMMLTDHKSSSSLHPHHHHHGGMVPSPVAVTVPGAPAPSSAPPVATVTALEAEASKSNPTWKKGSHEKDDRKKRSKHHRDEDRGESTTDVTSNATSCSTTYSEDYVRHHKKKHRSSSCCRRHAAPPAPSAPAGGMDMQQFALMAALLQGRTLPSNSREEGGGSAAWGDSAADKQQLVVRQLQREIQESNERMLDRMQQAIQRVEEGVERKISEANRHMVMRLEKDEQQRSSAMEGVASHLAEATKSTSLQIRALQDEVRQHSESQMTAIRQQLATLSVSAPTISMPATARSQSPSVLPPLAVSSPLQSNNNHNNININNNSVNLSNPNIYSDSHQPHQQLPGQLTLPSHQARPKLDLSAISNTEAPTTHNTSTTAFGPRVVSATVSVTDERPPNDLDVTSNDDDDDDDPYVPMHEQGPLKLPCEHCRLRFPAKELPDHEQQCELRMLTCPNCRASIVARKFATHRCDLTSPVDLSSSLTRRSSSKMLQDTQDELQRLLEEEARDEARKAAAASKS